MTRTAALLPLLLAGAAVAQDAVPRDATAYDAAMEQIKQRCERLDQKDAAADVKVWTGVIADRKSGTVTVLAAATGIKKTDPLEFYVTPVETGKDYEALAVTPATPSAVHAALAFIGLTPGRPIDANKNRFWARGPRVAIDVVRAGKKTAGSDLAADARTGTPISGELLFAGSYAVRDGEETVLAADKADARPIAPLYEDPAAVLAVPRRAPQSVVYGFQKPTAAAEWTRGELVEFVLTADPRQVSTEGFTADVRLRLEAGEPRYVMTTLIDGRPSESPTEYRSPQFVNLMQDRRATDLFVKVRPDTEVLVSDVRKLYAILQLVERDRGLKLDQPDDGELYGRAFFPEPQWRDRGKRLGEPWELILTREHGKIVAKLERSADDPALPAGSPPVVTSQAVADPAAFVKAVNDNPSKWTRSIFVLPPADLTYGELMAWVRPVLATYPRVFVFPAEAPATRP